MRRKNGTRSPLKRSETFSKTIPPPAPALDKPSIGNTIKDGVASGMSFGIGSAVAHRAIDTIAGPRKIEVDRKHENICPILIEHYRKCLETKHTVNNCSEIVILMERFNC